MGRRDLGVYVHIPFCVRKCDYCDFLSGTAGKGVRDRYVEALLRDIKGVASGVREGYAVRSVFFGGGTPSVLEPGEIERILVGLDRAFGVDLGAGGAEITLEANPGTLSMEKLRGYGALGVNRLSLGLQSAVDEELKRLGRIHSYDEFLKNFWDAREAGFSNVNVDLMSGLPGQSMKSWELTLNRVIGLGPEHVSAYGLMIEEGTAFYERFQDEAWKSLLPDEELDRTMYERTKELLLAAGYGRYEISNYAKDGWECRHNCFYWDGTEYLGLGLGASSYFMGERFFRERDLVRYMEDAGILDLRRERERVTKIQRMEEFMFLGLRMSRGVDRAVFADRFYCEMDVVYGKVIEELVKNGLLVAKGDCVCLSDAGVNVSNRVLAEFLLEG